MIKLRVKEKANIVGIRTKTMTRFWISDVEIDKWLRNTITFFLLGMGRSGTEFFAKLLNKASGASVYHEPVKEDLYALVKAHKSKEDALNYVKKFRKKAIYILGHKKGIEIYSESNSNYLKSGMGLQDLKKYLGSGLMQTEEFACLPIRH